MRKIILLIVVILMLGLVGCTSKTDVSNNKENMQVENISQNIDVNNQNTDVGDDNIIFENDLFVLIGSSAPEDAWYTPDYKIVTLDSKENEKFVIKYSWNSDVHYYINGNILSLLVIAPYENGIDCYVYNIDVVNKKVIFNKELIELAKADYLESLKKVKQITLDNICTNENYERLKSLDIELKKGNITQEEMMSIMSEKYEINADVKSIITAYEEEYKKDSAKDLYFYLNENGDICYVKKYTDNLGSEFYGEYMYNLTKDERINEFGVYAG